MASLLSCGITNYMRGILSAVDSTGKVHANVVQSITNDPNPTEYEGQKYFGSDPRNLSIDNKTNLADLVLNYHYDKPIGGYPGSAYYGVYKPSAAASWGSAVANPALDGMTNPYGLVHLGDSVVLINYDYNDATKKPIVRSYNATTYATEKTYEYAGKYAADQYYPHGNGLDSFDAGRETNLVAIFNLTNSSYAYKPSALVVLDEDLKAVGKREDLTENANAVTVYTTTDDEHYAFVTAFGGSQVIGGNGAKSTLQVCNLDDLTAAPVTIQSEAGKGDFVDSTVVGETAYILRSYFGQYYEYHYTLTRIAVSDLIAGNWSKREEFSADDPRMTGGTAWMLAPFNGGLWFVAGDDIHTVNLSASTKEWLAGKMLTKRADASKGSLGTAAVQGHVNTATVAIDQITTPRLTSKAATGRSVVRVKMSTRVVAPEEWEKRLSK